MNAHLFQQLLYQSEGPELDFKRDGYAFKGGVDEISKSKLLKDILTFANSWKVKESHILIGVDDLPDGSKHPCGINPNDHIDDATLQQFVSSKTNRPVDFSCDTFKLNEKTFSVITIPKQKRPIYAVKDYGIVKAGEVYFRRGSGSVTASPDEIHKMGVDDALQDNVEPIIRIEFADLVNRRPLGNSLSIHAIWHVEHSVEDYPDLKEEGRHPAILFAETTKLNSAYWKEVATYTFHRRAFKGIGLVAINTSGKLARNVQLEIECTRITGVRVLEDHYMPEFPVERKPAFDIDTRHIENPFFKTIKPTVHKHDDRWTITSNFQDIQAKATAWMERKFFIASKESGEYLLNVTVYSHDISQPQRSQLSVIFDIESRPKLTLEELQEIVAKRQIS